MVKNPPANAGDAGDSGSIPPRSPGVGNGSLLQYSYRSLVGYSPWVGKELGPTERVSDVLL